MKKVITSLLIIIFMLSMATMFISAEVLTFTFKTKVPLESGADQYLIYLDPSDSVYKAFTWIGSKHDLMIETDYINGATGNHSLYFKSLASDSMFKRYLYSTSTGNWTLQSTWTNQSMTFGQSANPNMWYTNIKYSTADIDSATYNGTSITSNETVFFYKVLQQPEKLLAGLSPTNIFSMTYRQILFLIPLLMGLVISFLGLRKALALVSNLLHKA